MLCHTILSIRMIYLHVVQKKINICDSVESIFNDHNIGYYLVVLYVSIMNKIEDRYSLQVFPQSMLSWTLL